MKRQTSQLLLTISALFTLLFSTKISAQTHYCSPCIDAPCLEIQIVNNCPNCPVYFAFTQGGNPSCAETPTLKVNPSSTLAPYQLPCLSCDLGQCKCPTGLKLLDPCDYSPILIQDFINILPISPPPSFPYSVNYNNIFFHSQNCCGSFNGYSVTFTFTSPNQCIIEVNCL